eukprot:9268822-Pyramimonas_sp.AAC.1
MDEAPLSGRKLRVTRCGHLARIPNMPPSINRSHCQPLNEVGASKPGFPGAELMRRQAPACIYRFVIAILPQAVLPHLWLEMSSLADPPGANNGLQRQQDPLRSSNLNDQV